VEVLIDQGHIVLDGTTYLLAESDQGTHYNLEGQPLRPPNAVTVQGIGAGQKFQPRPDALLWNITDWSGGEGVKKFRPTDPSRSWELNGVRAFTNPGELTAGYYVEDVQDSTGASDLVIAGVLVTGIDNLYLLDANAANVYTWDAGAEKFGAATALTGVAAGANDQAAGDLTHIYWIEAATNNVWKWDGAAAFTKISDTVIVASNASYLTQLGANCYVYRPLSGIVWEVPKSGSTTIVIDSWTESGNTPGGNNPMTVLDGKIYVMVPQPNKTMIREIVPTTAAGTGFGAEIARIHGFQGEAMWSHAGTLYVVGRYRDDNVDRTVLYLIPGGDYGSLGNIRNETTMGQVAAGEQATRMLDHFFVTSQLTASDARHGLFQVDSVTGGYGLLAINEDGNAKAEAVRSVVAHKGEIFWSVTEGAATKRTQRARADQYTKVSTVISPWHDFDLVGDKNLNTMELKVQALPADWTVTVDYAADGATAWTNAISYTTTGGKGTSIVVSTDSTTVVFGTLRLRVGLTYTGGGIPTSAPVVLGVEVWAQLVRKVRVHQLLLNLSDDHGAGKQSKSGSSKIDLFQATVLKNVAVDFQDGYTSPRTGEKDTYDVTVDAYNLVLSAPGEGVGAVTLREVV